MILLQISKSVILSFFDIRNMDRIRQIIFDEFYDTMRNILINEQLGLGAEVEF